MKSILCLLGSGVCAAQLLAADPPLFQADFSEVEVGTVPAGFRVLDGAFAVRQDGTNRFLELPGAPLESYGALFGPVRKDGVRVSGRMLGTAKGRRFPTFAVGLGGFSGYRLQISPGKKELELWRGEEEKASVPFQWLSGKWTRLELQVRQFREGNWKIEGRAWSEDASPPAEWMIAIETAEEPRNGQAGIYGSPFAGTPIAYDDLVIAAIPDK